MRKGTNQKRGDEMNPLYQEIEDIKNAEEDEMENLELDEEGYINHTFDLCESLESGWRVLEL